MLCSAKSSARSQASREYPEKPSIPINPSSLLQLVPVQSEGYATSGFKPNALAAAV